MRLPDLLARGVLSIPVRGNHWDKETCIVAEPSPDGRQDLDQLPEDIQQLITAIDALPGTYRDRMMPVVSRVLQSTRRRRRILHLVQEAISQLRLDMKYLVFDLEATRRERDDYRHQLEESNR